MKEIETAEAMAARLYPTRRPETAIASAAARAMVADAVEQRDAQIAAALNHDASYGRYDAETRDALRAFASRLRGAP